MIYLTIAFVLIVLLIANIFICMGSSNYSMELMDKINSIIGLIVIILILIGLYKL